ncbi:MAG TPA: carbonic anhydrase family protein [Gemmatales bacterium]|nr:carbonic anhydrase family protein [Gemmatales bacterium]
MSSAKATPFAWRYDLTAGIAVFLVALPLCLGVASASGAPHLAGVIAGIIGGIVVGFLSCSHTSVSGPAAGLTAVVFAQIAALGSFEAFLTALLIAGLIQILFGVFKAGFIAEFFPSSVIKGLLTAIGLILILKQIPHLVGHDPDPEGDWSFFQADQKNTFTEIIDTIFDLQPGALVVGFVSLLALMAWDRIKVLKSSIVPGPLVIVVLGVVLYHLLKVMGGVWLIEPTHLVQVPTPKSWNETLGLLKFPELSYLAMPAVYVAAATIAIVASLETLLNLDAVDKIDPQQRRSPPSRELLAQGIGNFLCGMIGGIPVTSVIVRSTVNINAGARSKLSAIIHGVFLLVFVVFLPGLLNQIPLSCLAAILILTGFKLAHPKNFISMWKQGRSQFLPFITTVLAILFTDLLIGIIIGLVVSVGFILQSNLRRPLSKVLEKHASGDVLRIRLANQVSFLNKATLSHMLDTTPDVKHVLIDATDTDYIDPDILDLIDTYKNETGPARGVHVSVIGFRKHYRVDDRILFVDYTTQELRDKLTPDEVIEILKAGNKRFLSGDRLSRDLLRQLSATAASQFPMAVILSCIDSRAPTEMIFDLGLGDVFTIRMAGNVAGEKELGSMEYACVVSGAKLILVMGHTRCGAVTTAVELTISGKTAEEVTGCQNIDSLIKEIQFAVDPDLKQRAKSWTDEEKQACVDEVAKKNVLHTIQIVRDRSDRLRKLAEDGRIKIVGCLYDIRTGTLEFL